jgi:predicted MFS family arabinose efflux permease
MRIAVSATAESITATLGPLAGGVVAEAYGYPLVFGASVGFLALGLLLLLTAVQDPRHRARA